MFYFARMQDDGRITSPMNPGYSTLMALKAAAPNVLRTKREHGGKFVVIQVLEEIKVTATVEFEKLKPSTLKKHGRGSVYEDIANPNNF